MKKEIVFVEYVPNIINLKIARTLKLSGKYTTTLISFSKVDEELYNKAFDKLLILDVKHSLNLKNIIKLFKSIFSKETKDFIKSVKELDPYLFQITGPDLFTMFVMSITKNKPKIYFAYDIWAFYGKKFSIKNLGIKEFFQKQIEKIGFRKADGILHKGPSGELKFLDYKINKLDLAILPGCLDEWTISNNKKPKAGEIHLVFAGGPLKSSDGRAHFLEVIKKITSQNIHFHTYGECVNKKDTILFVEEEKKNKYYHFHPKERVDNLNKKMSQYTYGINPDFYIKSIINPLWPKTSVANRMFNYIEAGIPIIINEDAEYMMKIVKDNEIGFSIKYNDLDNLKDIIEKRDYKKMIDNTKKAQKKFSWNKNLISELEEFYKKVIKDKSRKVE